MAKKVVKKTKASPAESLTGQKQLPHLAKQGLSSKRAVRKKTVRQRNSGRSTVAADGLAFRDNPVQMNTTSLTPEQLQHFRQLLLDKLAEITGDVDHIESGALKASRADSTGDLSSMPIHMADIGSDNYEQEFALGLMHSERQIVNEIIAALKRIDNRTYGVCEGTGEPIPVTRLEGIPWARYCLRYAATREKGRTQPFEQAQALSEDPQAPEQQEMQLPEDILHDENDSI